VKSIKVPFPDFKDNQHRTFYGSQKGYEGQKLARVKGARKREGKGQEKNGIRQQKQNKTKQNKSNFWLMCMLQSKTLYILVPNP